MTTLGIKDAFLRYDATLRNVQWSVSAWATDGSLVVSLWDHHTRKGSAGTLEFADSANRWHGPGNKEFRENVAKAYESSAPVRLVIARTEEIAHVEAGEDASKIKKIFSVRQDLVGKVIEWDGSNYAFRFTRQS
ncbi:MAG TPA: hypothetical protein PL023_00735 [Thiobacillus sp.]|nr:hypothetical protein [Thiobacillus sp.]